jgi:hypothetical protein
VYSLVSAPVLGFDLARLDGGAATAELLLAALTLAPEDLRVLASRLPDDQLRAELWQEVDAADLRRIPVRALASLDPTISLRLVERAPIGSLDGLLHCLRRDVLDWTWNAGQGGAAGLAEPTVDGSLPDGPQMSTMDGGSNGSTVDGATLDRAAVEGAVADGSIVDGSSVDASLVDGSLVDRRPDRPRDEWPPAGLDEYGMPRWLDAGRAGRSQRPLAGRQTDEAARASALLCDALVASYLREELSAATRRGLAAGWVGAVRRLPARPADLGPQHRPVSRALDRVRRSGPGEWSRLTEAVDRNRQQMDWATAMHSASWAVYLSGRVRSAAAAQLLLVIAVRDAGISIADLAAGCWNALSGAVHAQLVSDLLDLSTGQHLLEPYLSTFGPNADLG